ncbi:MAG: hypothetical protein E6I45_09605 [Chloroflexi bacterium]|nr:MAG: hypothetical protein E6I45_09605 [Chloroflexota bacterium]
MTAITLSDGQPEGGALEILLQAYARAELQPDTAALGRMRANVLAAVGTQFPRPSLVERVRGAFAGFGGRRAVLAFVTASLVLFALAGGAFAASRAGGPLYGTRLNLETLTLPSEANARTDAQIARLQARLDEASDGAIHGNGAAVTAALDAYRQILDEALAAAGDDVDRDLRLELELERHRVVLTALVGELPDGAAEAIQRVLDRQAGTIDAIKASGRPAEPGANGQGQGAGGQAPAGQGPDTNNVKGTGGQGGGGDQGGGQGNAGSGATAEPSPKPSHDPHPSTGPASEPPGSDHSKAP